MRGGENGRIRVMKKDESEPVRGEVFGGAFSEAAAFVRVLVAKGEMTFEEALIITEKAYRQTMVDQLAGRPLVPRGRPEELPEDAELFQKQG